MIESVFWGACLGHLIGYLIVEGIRFYIRNKKNRKITCKDCKWWQTAGCAVYIVDESDMPRPHDFCSFAEEKNR